MGSPVENCGKGDFEPFDLKNRFEVLYRPTNIVGCRLDIVFDFVNDWHKNIHI